MLDRIFVAAVAIVGCFLLAVAYAFSDGLGAGLMMGPIPFWTMCAGAGLLMLLSAGWFFRRLRTG